MRFFAFFAAFVILGMIYWSSLLTEESLREIKGELVEIKKLVAAQKGGTIVSETPKTKALTNKNRPFIDEKYPNLLREDPFYIATLPKLLGQSFAISGVRREAYFGRPEHLHPFNSFRDVSHLWSLCTLQIAEPQFGKYELFAPAAAIKIEERPHKTLPGISEFWVHLREGMYWAPLAEHLFPTGVILSPHFLSNHSVTAHDYKFFFDAVMNPYVGESKAAALRNYLGDIEEFEVIDDLTFVVRWKALSNKIKYAAFSLTCGLQPLPCFVYKYFADGSKIVQEDEDRETYRKNSVWAQNFSHHFAKNIIPSCGPWIFASMTEEGIRLKRNPQFYNRHAALVEEIHFTFKQSFEAMWQDFKAGAIDFCNLPPSQLPELDTFLKSPLYISQKEKGLSVNALDFVEQSYYYIGWNAARSFFSDKKVRWAMTMAIDRNRILSQNLNDMGVVVTGPFFCYSPSYDSSIRPWPYNPEEAKRLLEEEGWVDADGDGIREKLMGGKRIPFDFTLLYFAKNDVTKVICEFVATSLKEVGVRCRARGMDIADLSHAFEDKSFDAIYFGWSLGSPPEDPKQLWHSSGAKEKASSNAVGFANGQADALIEKLEFESDPMKRIALYHAFHRLIHDEAPYTFLYSPKRHLLYRDYVHNLIIPRERQDLIPDAVAAEPDFRAIFFTTSSEKI